MHPNPIALQRLHDHWAREAGRRRFAPTAAVDDYHAAEHPDEAPLRKKRSVLTCQELERYIVRYGRFPCRGHGPDEASERLLDWIRYQRRSVDRLSAYQRARLELLPGWTWDPREDAWFDRLHSYELFVRDLGRVPRRSAEEREEQRLSLWHRNQHRKSNAGTLTKTRSDLFRQLNARVEELLRQR